MVGVFMAGLKKYERDNYYKLPVGHRLRAAYRHLEQDRADFDSVDDDTGCDHLVMAIADLMMEWEIRHGRGIQRS